PDPPPRTARHAVPHGRRKAARHLRPESRGDGCHHRTHEVGHGPGPHTRSTGCKRFHPDAEENTMKSRRITVVGALLCLGLVSSGAAWGAQSPAKQLDERFLEAFNANDLEGILGCYADDAVIYPPGEFIARGRDAI